MQSQSSNLRRHVLATVLFLSCAYAAAQDRKPTELDRIVITATRTAQTQDETLAAITVIDREDIERLQPSSLIDLLRGTPGLSLSNNGGAGKATSVFLRGTESDHVLVMIDGVKIGSATNGGAAFQDIPVELIERIEIVRGPFSSLYGSEALGGVIQIFTRRPEGGFVPHFNVAGGSFGTRRGGAGVAGKVGAGWYSLNAAHERADGINACRGKPSPGGAGCFTNEPDEDGYRNTSFTAQGGYRFSDAWDAEARVLRASGDNESDGSSVNRAEFVQQVAGGRVRFAPDKRFSLTLHGGRSDDRSDNFRNATFSSKFNTRRDVASLQADIAAGDGLISLGYDWQEDRVQSSTRYAVDQRINRAVFGQWQQTFGDHSLQASARRDDNSQFGGQTTGSALWGWNFVEDLRLTASYGTAFKAPTFNELYFPGFGNAMLRPEHARSAELGLRGNHGWGDWTLSAYENVIDDLIAFDAAIFAPGNVDRARIQGVEAGLGVAIAGWNVNGSLTWLDPHNESNTVNRDKILPRRARKSGRIDVDRDFGAFGVGGSVFAAGERYDDLGNKRRLPGYSLIDLRANYAFNSDWRLEFNVANALDRVYETAAFFNQPGRSYTLGLRYRLAQ